MKYFIDTEFIEDGLTVDLISIGIVSEDGRQLYLENSECDLSRANNWVKANVFPFLTGCTSTKAEIREAVKDFVICEKPEFWGYYADYDWVVFCQLFGKMIDLPKGYPFYCRDVQQIADDAGVDVSHFFEVEQSHNALIDAICTKTAYEALLNKRAH